MMFHADRVGLTELQQLRRDSFTNPGTSTGHYRYFMVEQAWSEHTVRRHVVSVCEERGEEQQRPLLETCSTTATCRNSAPSFIYLHSIYVYACICMYVFIYNIIYYVFNIQKNKKIQIKIPS